MILLLLVVIAMATAGFALTEWLWRRESARGDGGGTPLERACTWCVLTFAIWTGLNWLLAASHHWRTEWVVAGSIVVGAPGIWGTYKLARRISNRELASAEAARLGLVALVLAPAGLWVLFVLWRSTLLPVLSHDGLNYHMPKAVFLIREGGVGWFQTSNLRIAEMPYDYEFILSTILMLTGSDQLTAWPTTVSYVFFLIGSAALAERFWGRGLHLLAAPLLTGAVPLALLHSGAHKNDLLIAALNTTAFTMFGRWTARGGFAPAVVTIVALALATGSKFWGLFTCLIVAALLLAFALAGRRQAFRFARREWVALAATVGIGTALLGGITYGLNFYESGHLVGPPPETVTQSSYGQWSNLWMFTVMLLMRPFASSIRMVWNPWYGESWWWLKYDLYSSHFGMAFTVLAVVLPFAVYRYARRSTADGRGTERWMASLPFLLTYVAIVAYRLRPLGLFCSFGRYVLFVVPVVVAWTAVPLARELLAASAWRARLGHALLAVCSAAFVASAVDAAINDEFAPLGLVVAAMARPDIRLSDIGYTRAAIIADSLAGPDDHVAISGDFDTYLYPAFGHERRRRVSFIPDGPGPAHVPEDARWVIVDRTLNKYWNHPDWTNMGQFDTYFRKGIPSADDVRVALQLERDPAWKLVYRDAFDTQAVFVREAKP